MIDSQFCETEQALIPTQNQKQNPIKYHSHKREKVLCFPQTPTLSTVGCVLVIICNKEKQTQVVQTSSSCSPAEKLQDCNGMETVSCQQQLF